MARSGTTWFLYVLSLIIFLFWVVWLFNLTDAVGISFFAIPIIAIVIFFIGAIGNSGEDRKSGFKILKWVLILVGIVVIIFIIVFFAGGYYKTMG